MKFLHIFKKTEEPLHNLVDIDRDYHCHCGATVRVKSGMVLHREIDKIGWLMPFHTITKFIND